MNILGIDLIPYALGAHYLYDLDEKHYVTATFPATARYQADYSAFFSELIKEIKMSRNLSRFEDLKKTIILGSSSMGSDEEFSTVIDRLISRIKKTASTSFIVTQVVLAFAEIRDSHSIYRIPCAVHTDSSEHIVAD